MFERASCTGVGYEKAVNEMNEKRQCLEIMLKAP
jgi:hypothetical protein